MVDRQKDALRLLSKAAFSQKSNPSKSIVLYQRYLTFFPNSPLIYLSWADLLMKLKKYREAERKLGKIRQISPETIMINVNRYVESLYHQRRFYDITIVIEKFIDQTFSPYIFHNIWGMCLLHLGKYEEAIAQFQKSIQLFGKYSLAYLNWALVLHLQGKSEKAKEVLEKSEYEERNLHRLHKEYSWLEDDLKDERNEEKKKRIKKTMKSFEFIIEIAKEKIEEKVDERFEDTLYGSG